jgi:hypothetical protein
MIWRCILLRLQDKMLCISRITEDTYCQNFGNGHNKFYVELRCNVPCSTGSDVCGKCSQKSSTCKVQHSRKFDHGKVNEPIPDNSHIYGSKWYKDSVKKYGAPESDSIDFAEQYQRDARSNIVVSKPIIQPTQPEVVVPVKKTRKPKVADESSEATPVKRSRKPKVAPEPSSTDSNEIVIETQTETSKKVTNSRKKVETTPYSTLVNNKAPLVYKEVSLPTHIETKLEDIDIDGFTIEYIQLSQFEHNGSTYFRDIKKNKLYKKVKDKIGPYIGRYNPDSDCVVTDIPDSDDEN